MKVALSILAYGLLASLAIMSSYYFFENPGYVLLSIGKSYVEMTLYSLILVLISIWLGIKLLIIGFKKLMGWRTKWFNKSEEKAQLALRQGMTAFLLKDFKTGGKITVFSR